MSNQEHPFKPPEEEPSSEQQTGEQRGLSRDPRERPQPEMAMPQMPPGYPPQGYPALPRGNTPLQGYPSPQGYYAAPTVARPRRRSPWVIALIVLIVMLFSLVGLAVIGTLLGFGFGIGGARINSATEQNWTFPVGAGPELLLTSDVGSVTINRGSTKNIVVHATKHVNFGGNLNDGQIISSQSGSTVNVAFHGSYLETTSVDFSITVPPTCDLNITTHAGGIQVNGIGGKLSLLSNAGSIMVTDASLSGSSTVRTNAGSITFTGSISSTGTYDFETNSGSIDIALPTPTSFHLNATTYAGSISTSFPVTVIPTGAVVTANGDVGTAPQATLTLKTDSGAITLK